MKLGRIAAFARRGPTQHNQQPVFRRFTSMEGVVPEFRSVQFDTKWRPLVIAGPSGVGKGTIIDLLKKDHPSVFGKAITHTTRQPRVGEKHGVNYYYTTREELLSDFEAGKFIEKAEIHGNIYGTSIKAVQDVASEGKICILDIDVQGCESAKKAGVNPLCIFLLPPSLDELRKRLTGRGTETPEQIETRMNTALRELEWQKKPDFWHYIITNDSLESCYAQIKAIISKEYPVGKL